MCPASAVVIKTFLQESADANGTSLGFLGCVSSFQRFNRMPLEKTHPVRNPKRWSLCGQLAAGMLFLSLSPAAVDPPFSVLLSISQTDCEIEDRELSC